jgi:hypothetical protein
MMMLVGKDNATLREQNGRNAGSFREWAESLASAAREGLRYERWWEARLPIEEIRRQFQEEQIEKGVRAFAALGKLKA